MSELYRKLYNQWGSLTNNDYCNKNNINLPNNNGELNINNLASVDEITSKLASDVDCDCDTLPSGDYTCSFESNNDTCCGQNTINRLKENHNRLLQEKVINTVQEECDMPGYTNSEICSKIEPFQSKCNRASDLHKDIGCCYPLISIMDAGNGRWNDSNPPCGKDHSNLIESKLYKNWKNACRSSGDCNINIIDEEMFDKDKYQLNVIKLVNGEKLRAENTVLGKFIKKIEEFGECNDECLDKLRHDFIDDISHIPIQGENRLKLAILQGFMMKDGIVVFQNG